MATDQQPLQAPRSSHGVSNRNPPLLRGKHPLPYGYHNSFHTHAQDAQPPTYAEVRRRPLEHSILDDIEQDVLPSYTCTVCKNGLISLMIEFRDPFLEGPGDKIWQKVYASLRGTQLCLHWAKSQLNTNKAGAKPGKKIAQFSLQHAEVGLAVDVRPDDSMPRNAVINMLPSNIRKKLQKTKPHLFETQREWLLRLRVEGYQLLMSFDTEATMLDWCEKICEAIDISAPLDDRTEPRYRSLPRRSRRQRQLENPLRDERSIDVSNLSGRLVEQQERILRRYYPNLATGSTEDGYMQSNNQRSDNPANQRSDNSANQRNDNSANPRNDNSANPRNNNSVNQRNDNSVIDHTRSMDPDMDDFDPADVAELRENITPQTNSSDHSPKGRRRSSTPSLQSELRYRRRCMPIMYKYSPRSSEIIFYKDARWRIDAKKGMLRTFEMAPPRYPRGKKGSSTAEQNALAMQRMLINARRPRPLQATSEESDAPDRTNSDSSGRAEEADAISVHSANSLVTGSANDSIEPVSTRASLGPQSPRDEISEVPMSPGISVLAFKEKTTPLLERRRPSRTEDEEVLHAFAGLIL